MADKHDLEIIIAPDGQFKMEVKGMKGKGCLEALKKAAEKLGKIESQELKPEYYEEQKKAAQKRTG